MAVVINSVDSKTFELNGIHYLRIYQPLDQGLYQIGLYSVFDTKLQLINSTHFSEYIIDGSTYLTQAETIEALLSITYSRTTIIEGGDIIYEPDNEPQIVLGVPNTLTIDLVDNKYSRFEPQYNGTDYNINVDFTLSFTNRANLREVGLYFMLSGTRIITFPSYVSMSVPSTIGVWDNLTKTLTLSTGIEDLILMIGYMNKTTSYIDFSVNEVSVY